MQHLRSALIVPRALGRLRSGARGRHRRAGVLEFLMVFLGERAYHVPDPCVVDLIEVGQRHAG